MLSSINMPTKALPGRDIKIETNVTEAVSGVLYYELMTFWYAGVDPAAMRKYNDKIFNNVNKNFNKYMDQRARALPTKYHHVYEWNMIGRPGGRLWKLRKRNSGNASMEIRYDFLTSKVRAPIHPLLAKAGPTGKRVTKSTIFKNKAYVMEEGIPVTIRPKNGKYLAIPNIYGFDPTTRRGDVIFTQGPVVVKQPGGPGVKYSFAKTFSGYFSSGLAVKDLQNSRALDTPARITKKAGEDIPSAIYKVSSSRGVDKDFIAGIARRNVEKYERGEYA